MMEFEECVHQLLGFLHAEGTAADSSVTQASALVQVAGSLSLWHAAATIICMQQLEGCVCTLVSGGCTVSPVARLLLVKKVLQFCREGEVTSSALFQALGSCLTSLFKATCALLKASSLVYVP